MKSTTPKPQKYPASLIKVGATLYSVFVYADDNGKVATGYEEWIVRSVKAKRGSKSRMGLKAFAHGDTRQYVNLTQKVDLLTWGKRAGKTGWLASIPSYCTKQFPVGNELPHGLYATKRAALVYAIRDHQDTHKRYDKWIAEETDPHERAELIADRVTHETEMRALATRFKKGWPAAPKSAA